MINRNEALKTEIFNLIVNAGERGYTNRELIEYYMKNTPNAVTVEDKASVHSFSQSIVAQRRQLELEGMISAIGKRKNSSEMMGTVYVASKFANLASIQQLQKEKYYRKALAFVKARNELEELHNDLTSQGIKLVHFVDIMENEDGFGE